MEELFNFKELCVDYLQILIEDNREKAIEYYKLGDLDVAKIYLNIANIFCSKIGYIKPCTLEELVAAEEDKED